MEINGRTVAEVTTERQRDLVRTGLGGQKKCQDAVVGGWPGLDQGRLSRGIEHSGREG